MSDSKIPLPSHLEPLREALDELAGLLAESVVSDWRAQQQQPKPEPTESEGGEQK